MSLSSWGLLPILNNLRLARHRFVNGEYLNDIRVDMAGDKKEPWVNIAWKFIWTAKDSWLGPSQALGSIPAVYNLTMDPFEDTT